MIRFENYPYSKYTKEMRRIYLDSFPKFERFDFRILKKCSRHLSTNLSIILSDDAPVGMMFMIFIPHGITYLMYFAIDSQSRNDSIGSKALQKLIASKDKVMLVIEKPVDEITTRRKNFYLRNGLYDTGITFEDTGALYEVLISDKNYQPTEDDLLNRYRYMTRSKLLWRRIKRTFDTDSIKFIE